MFPDYNEGMSDIKKSSIQLQKKNAAYVELIKQQVYDSLNPGMDMEDGEILNIIDHKIFELSKTKMLSIEDREQLKYSLFNSIRRLDILQELLDNDAITEIMINGYQDIFYEKNGVIQRWEQSFESKERLRDIAQRIAGLSNRIVNEAVPILDTRLDDGSRVNIVLPPIALNGPIITIRKFYDTPITIEKLIEIGSISREAADFLKLAVIAKYNIFISGGTGSGKTTFLNALSNFIPSDERVITIEDSAELQIKHISNLVRLESRNANVEGKNEITIRDLIKASLRMRPDRIVVGEVRGAETIDMLQAMNTGHDGSLSTGHSNSPKDMLSRLQTMVLMGMDMPVDAIKQQISSAIDIIVHLGRIRDKTRKVLQIVEVLPVKDGIIELNPLFEFKETGEDECGRVIGTLEALDVQIENKGKFYAAGIQVQETSSFGLQ